jgi:hypothetical protein
VRFLPVGTTIAYYSLTQGGIPMSLTRASTIRSFAQFFCMLVVIASFGVAERAWAICSPSQRENFNYWRCGKIDQVSNRDDDCDKLVKPLVRCDNPDAADTKGGGGDPTDKCSSYTTRVEKTYSTFNEKCGSAGAGGGKNCMSAVKKCDQVALDNEGGSDDDVAKAFTAALGGSSAGVASKCPKYSGQGFMERKDKYEKDLDNSNDKLQNIKDDTAELNDKFNKDVQSIQEDIQKAQEEVQTKQLELNKEQRSRQAEQVKTTAQIAEQIRSKTSEMLQLRNQISDTYQSKNSNLVAMTENAANRSCMKKVNDLKKELGATTSGSSGAFFSKASNKVKQLNDTFNECMSQFDIQRAALITKTEQAVELIQNKINNNQSDIDNANQQLSTMTAQEQQAKTDDATGMTNANKSVTDKITRAQTRLTSLSQTTKTKSDALAEKQKYYENKSKQTSTAIGALGAMPSDETSTTKMSQVVGAYEDFKEAAMSLNSMDECKSRISPDACSAIGSACTVFSSSGTRKAAPSTGAKQ